MGILRNRHDDDHGRRYQMRQQLLSIGDDFWIEDDQGDRAFRVDGKAVRARDTWVLKDPAGNDVAEIKERKLSIRDAMKLHVRGREATVKKRLVGIRDHYHIEVDGGPDLKAHGNVVDHEYEIDDDHGTIGTVSKKWFRVRDTYGVEVAEGTDPALVLSVAVAIDAMSRDR